MEVMELEGNNRPTDRRTDRQTQDDSMHRASIASRGKKWAECVEAGTCLPCSLMNARRDGQ